MRQLPDQDPEQTVLGVLMLDTRFPRPCGDIGNPGSFSHPVIHRRLPGAIVSRVVTDQPLPDELANRFADAARGLERDGATLITTSCGFLYPLQDRLQAAVSVPVVTSALCLLPELRRQTAAGQPIGILTFDSAQLSAHHIPDAGPVVIEGLDPDDHLYRVIAGDLPRLDQAIARMNAADALHRLLSRHDQLQAVILECTNLPPYKRDLSAVCHVPIFDIHDALNQLGTGGIGQD